MPAETKGTTVEPAGCGDGAVRVIGRVRKPLVVGMESLRAMDTEEVADLMIICGEGDPKGNIRNCKGVLLENIINMADVIKEGHNDTKKMFVVATANDGYKVVFPGRRYSTPPWAAAS